MDPINELNHMLYPPPPNGIREAVTIDINEDDVQNFLDSSDQVSIQDEDNGQTAVVTEDSDEPEPVDFVRVDSVSDCSASECSVRTSMMDPPKVYRDFDQNLFNKLALFKILESNPMFGEIITKMDVDPMVISDKEVAHLKNIVSNIQYEQNGSRMELRICSASIKLMVSLLDILMPGESDELSKVINKMGEDLNDFNYDLSIFNEIFSLPADSLQFKRVRPINRFIPLLMQYGVVIAMDSVPKVLQKFMASTTAGSDEPPSKKRKIN